jgi:hypothetical protein
MDLHRYSSIKYYGYLLPNLFETFAALIMSNSLSMLGYSSKYEIRIS